MSNPFNEDGSLTCEICGKGLWGGPLGHLDKDWMNCNIKLQEEVERLREALKLLLYYIDLEGQFGRTGGGEALAEARLALTPQPKGVPAVSDSVEQGEQVDVEETKRGVAELQMQIRNGAWLSPPQAQMLDRHIESLNERVRLLEQRVDCGGVNCGKCQQCLTVHEGFLKIANTELQAELEAARKWEKELREWIVSQGYAEWEIDKALATDQASGEGE